MLSYLYSAGLGAMLFFVFASLVLNIVSIATTAWTEPNDIGLWLPCVLNGEYRPKCFKTPSQALIATGTALNCLAFILSVASQASHVLEKFKNTIGQFVVLGAMVTSILCLIFNSIGWYLVFFSTYQNIQLPTGANVALSAQTMVGLRLGWSFWLMTPSFFCSTLAAIVAAAILGCGCTSKVLERQNRSSYQQDYNNQPAGDERKDRYDGKATDTAGKDNLFVSRF